MGKLYVRDVYGLIDAFAPFDTQMDFDNAGLLAGSYNNEVTGILCALDLNEAVITEAEEKGANLIVTHHPILFRGRKNLREDDAEGRMLCALIRKNMNLIAAHTNYDMAEGGVNDVLAAKLGMKNIAAAADGLLRTGDIEPMSLEQLTEKAAQILGDAVRSYGDRQKVIYRLAVCGGSAGEYAQAAFDAGADAYLTGEIRYHDAITAACGGRAVLECGHDATEKPAVYALSERLRCLDVPVYDSEKDILSASAAR